MTDRRKGGSTSKYEPRATSSTSTYVLAAVAVVVVAAIVVGGVLWNTHRGHSGGGVNEQVLNSNAALIIGAPGAPVTIDVFEDFMCPVCKEFEQQSGKAVVTAVDSGKLRVRYHMLNFLNDRSASGSYSSRAAGALQCVGAGENRDVFFRFHTALFAQQPQEGGDSDPSNADLARLAAQQGASAATQKCISDGAKVGEAEQAAKESQTQLAKATGGQVATPTVLSGGEPVSNILDGTAWLDELLNKPST
ncbi:DsbA family protein [Gordonia sp. NPDC003429]